jgi:platelet-activating factor acetylhydrolase IB subunit beta/gamma
MIEGLSVRAEMDDWRIGEINFPFTRRAAALRLCLCGTFLALMFAATENIRAADDAHNAFEPQKSGWPLTAQETKYVLTPEHERRPGLERNQYLPALWPVTPSAGYWGGTSWLDTHAGLVRTVQQNKGTLDILLIGDSITMQWGEAWAKHFGQYKTLNLGVGGDKTQNVLWRLDHGGVDGLKPRLIILQIGNNNVFFTPETGIAPVAKGIKACVDKLRGKFPQAKLMVVKIFPAHAPGERFYDDIKLVNAALDDYQLASEPNVQVLDLWENLVNSDGTLKPGLFAPDHIHLTETGGYEVYARRLKPLVEAILGGMTSVVAPAKSQSTPGNRPLLRYPYAAYNEGKMDSQLTGWPLTKAEREFVLTPEYNRKPGTEVSLHLPEMWPVTPTAGYLGTRAGDPSWLDKHEKLLGIVQTNRGGANIVLLGDDITQQWGGSVLGNKSIHEAWQNRFRRFNTLNLGVAGDRPEQILWRLDHGALRGLSPKVVVLNIGANYTPIISPCGVPVSAVAQGIKLCVDNVRAQCPEATVVLVKILPTWEPGAKSYEDTKLVNAALDDLKLDRDPKVQVLDLWSDFTLPDGSPKSNYFYGALLNDAGYEILAEKLKPLLERLLEN